MPSNEERARAIVREFRQGKVAEDVAIIYLTGKLDAACAQALRDAAGEADSRHDRMFDRTLDCSCHDDMDDLACWLRARADKYEQKQENQNAE